ncbi:MAG: MutS-related protein [Bacteroidales bacterium]
MSKKKKSSAIAFDESPDFDQISYYFNNTEAKEGEHQVSARFQNDIDFREVFERIDYTESNPGKQYLYYRLLTHTDINSFEDQEKWIKYMSENSGSEDRIASSLSLLDAHEAFYIARLFLDLSVIRPFYYKWLRILSLLPLIMAVAAFWNPMLLFFLMPLLIINLLIHYHNKNLLNVYQFSIPQLPLLMKCVRGLLAFDKEEQNQQVYQSLERLEKKRHKMSLFLFESKSDDALLSVLHTLAEYLKIFFLIEPVWAYDVLESLAENKADTEVLFKYAGKLDSYLSVYRLRKNVSVNTIPQWSDKPEAHLSFTGLYHPLIGNCVANDLRDSGKSILLTGSNMAGKTSFIRSVAINVLLSRSLNFAFAESITLSSFDVYSLIRVTDDLSQGASFFLEEVKGVKEMMDVAGDKSPKLFLMDELFKGTNTVERIASAKAVLSYLVNNPLNRVIISTHDIELAGYLSDEYELYHFSEEIKDDSIHFDYKLKKGILTTRNAIKILQLYNYPASVVEEALDIAAETN